MVIDSGDFARDRRRMLKLFRQIVEGVSYFHSKGVIHRDLNISQLIDILNFISIYSLTIFSCWIVMIALKSVILAWHDHSWIRQKSLNRNAIPHN